MPVANGDGSGDGTCDAHFSAVSQCRARRNAIHSQASWVNQERGRRLGDLGKKRSGDSLLRLTALIVAGYSAANDAPIPFFGTRRISPMSFFPRDLAVPASAPGLPIEWEEANCPLCGGRRWSPLVEASEAEMGTGLWFAVVQ